MFETLRTIVLAAVAGWLATAALPASAAPYLAAPGTLSAAPADVTRVHGYHCERLFGPSPWGLTKHSNPEACDEVYYEDEPDYYDPYPDIGIGIFLGPSGDDHRYGNKKRRYRRDGREPGNHSGH